MSLDQILKDLKPNFCSDSMIRLNSVSIFKRQTKFIELENRTIFRSKRSKSVELPISVNSVEIQVIRLTDLRYVLWFTPEWIFSLFNQYELLLKYKHRSRAEVRDEFEFFWYELFILYLLTNLRLFMLKLMLFWFSKSLCVVWNPKPCLKDTRSPRFYSRAPGKSNIKKKKNWTFAS